MWLQLKSKNQTTRDETRKNILLPKKRNMVDERSLTLNQALFENCSRKV